MRDTGAGFEDPRDICIADEIAVGENGSPRQQPEILERRGVAHAAAIEHESMRPVAFRAMSLNMTAGLARERTQAAQQLIRT